METLLDIFGPLPIAVAMVAALVIAGACLVKVVRMLLKK